MKRKTILEAKHLQYAYDQGTMALKDISLNISKGEKIAVIGPNGAGKSTFFLNLNGVLWLDGGEIIYHGNKMTKKTMNELRKNVSIVFQNADDQIIASTVQEEVSFGPMNLKLSKDQVIERVNEALDYMNLAEFKERAPHYLSGGEKKRVSIADMIAMHPEVIIFDEPTAALDPYNVGLFEEALQKLSAEGKTIMIATHDVDFVYRWSDRVIVFCDGRIIADDAPLPVFQNDAIVKQACLKRPLLLDVYETLREKEIIERDTLYPKNIEEFRNLFS